MMNRDTVLSFVQNNPGRTQQEISKALGITPEQQVNRILRALRQESLVYRDEQERPYKYYPVSASVQSTTESFPWKCAYCKGKGIDPGVIDGKEHDCPACEGTGWRTLRGSRDDYETCGRCGGNGIKPGPSKNPLIRWSDPCHICYGTGLVKVR